MRVDRPSLPSVLSRRYALSVALAVPIVLGASSVSAQPSRPEAGFAVDRMSAAAGRNVAATVSRATGLVSFVQTDPGAPIPLRASGTATERARTFLARYGEAFGLSRGVEAVPSRVSPPDETGMEHVRMMQTVRGVPVTGGELTVHLRGRSVVAVHAKTVPDLERVETDPVVTADEATSLARAFLRDEMNVAGAVLSEPRLELLNKAQLGADGASTDLVWFVEARKTDLREFMWFDARLGRLALRFSQLTDARYREVYDANDPADNVYGSLPGALVREEGQDPVGEWIPDAEAAWSYSGDTYDYFSAQHGRDSYDGAGASLISTVGFCPDRGNCPFQNAFWNGLQMVYGAGFALADDVAAHELTHAVTEHTARLFYYMQSGALNESYSDIFGETVDLLNAGGTDTPEVRWDLGEDVPELGAIRDLMEPTRFGDPGKTSDPEFECGDPGSDRGGVHSNSGVPNHAYALMVDGGTYNGIDLEAIGLGKAGKIHFRALSVYLVSVSDFIDNADALAQSCQDLVGTADITSEDCAQVDLAIRAVEMDRGWPCDPAQPAVPPLCGPEQTHETWVLEDFERLESPSPCSPGRLPKDWCINRPSSLLGEFATSGERSLWGYNQATTDLIEVRLEIPTETPLPENARLQLNHSYGFENTVDESKDTNFFWDGGVIEVTDDDGVTWADAGPLVTAGAGYGGIIDAREDNPLGGREAFVGDSWGYTASRLDLSSFAGGPFGIRFLVGTDYMLGDYGWFIDDVRIYTCVGCPLDRILDAGDNGTESHFRASRSIEAGNGFTVGVDEVVTLEAGELVALGDGFVAGGRLTVLVDPAVCP